MHLHSAMPVCRSLHQQLNNGIQLGKLLLSAKGGGTFVRITGTLILDCGHGLTSPCNDDPGDLEERARAR